MKSLESLLVDKGLVDRAALDALVDTFEHKVGPRNGARVVARAWVDASYKARLLSDPDRAIAELGYGGQQGEHMVVVENTPAVHNMIVCTLCSCYPWPVLGLPPMWYKSAPYRSRSVIDPRGVLRELVSGRPARGSQKAIPPLKAEGVAAWFAHGNPKRRPVDVAPRFRTGQQFRARNINPETHTRMPRYVRGKSGTVDRDHGVFVFPDTNAIGQGEKPQHVYSVRFTARELWGDQANPIDTVVLNLWDDDLDPI